MQTKVQRSLFSEIHREDYSKDSRGTNKLSTFYIIL